MDFVWDFAVSCYPLVMTNIANWKITMLSMEQLTMSMAIFYSYVPHNQRVVANQKKNR